MLNGPLPPQVDPRKLADCQAVLDYCVAFADLPRFASALLEPQGTVRMQLSFARDEGKTLILRSLLSTQVVLRCQRCLEPVTLDVQSQCSYALLPPGNDESTVSAQHELLELAESLALAELIEDELLLALPLVPAHPLGHCQIPAWNSQEAVSESKPNPFSVLAQLRQENSAETAIHDANTSKEFI